MVVEIFGVLLQGLGKFDDSKLHQCGTADRLLHAQFAPFHAPGEIHLTLARKQRYSAHFAEIDANGIVCVNRFFNLLLGVKKISFRFRIEKFSGFFVEVDA